MGLPHISGNAGKLVTGVCCLFLTFSTAFGIVVSDDPALHTVTSPSSFDRVGYLSTAGGTSGVLIGPWQILTAKHCVNGYSGGTFSLDLPTGRRTYSWTSANVTMHGSADLAVITLDTANYIGLQGYNLYTATDEVGKTGALVGYGMSGTGSTVAKGGDPNYPRGTKRVGYNRIDSVSDPNVSVVYYSKMDFDSPSTVGRLGGSLGVGEEAMFADGDSGGPTFIEYNGDLRIAGIHSSIVARDPNHWPAYGDTGRDVRISSYATWLWSNFVPWPGDANGNNVADNADYLIFSNHYGQKNVTWREGDFDLDGDVDFSDYLTLVGHWGAKPGTQPDIDASTVGVPEPMSFVLFLLAGWFGGRFRIRSFAR